MSDHGLFNNSANQQLGLAGLVSLFIMFCMDYLKTRLKGDFFPWSLAMSDGLCSIVLTY